jgi:hypothetical protein
MYDTAMARVAIKREFPLQRYQSVLLGIPRSA